MSAGRESLVDFVIPPGPFARAPRDLGEYAIARGDTTGAVREWLREVLNECGVKVGPYDERVLSWLARSVDWPRVQVLAGWVIQASSSASWPMSGVTSCVRCGAATVRTGDHFCAFCGAPVDPADDRL